MKYKILALIICLWLTQTWCIAKMNLPGKAKLIEGVIYKETPQGVLRLDIFKPDSTSHQTSPVFVFIHGGSWSALDRTTIRSAFRFQMLEKLLQEGYAVVSIDYRLVNDKNEVIYPEPLSDCMDAIRWIRKEQLNYGFDIAKIAVGGCSAGGHLALMTAYAPELLAPGSVELKSYSARVNCCVDIYGPTHLGKMFLPTLLPPVLALAHLVIPKAKMHERQMLLQAFTRQNSLHPWRRHRICKVFSPVSYVDRAVPTIIFHGNKDGLVPFAQSRLLQKKLQKRNKIVSLKVIEGQDHGFPTLDKSRGEKIAAETYNFLLRYNHT
jgi:acetyl esterase/lipase